MPPGGVIRRGHFFQGRRIRIAAGGVPSRRRDGAVIIGQRAEGGLPYEFQGVRYGGTIWASSPMN